MGDELGRMIAERRRRVNVAGQCLASSGGVRAGMSFSLDFPHGGERILG
jgi:hypothetical protein